jgi:hypothetical protein
MAVVSDGRTDKEKLTELLNEVEENHLEFKSAIDLDELEDKLKLVKDLVTLSARPPGGYLLIGVDNGGKPCLPQGTIKDRARFDGARLGDLVRRNIEAQINIRSQIHDDDAGNEIVLVYVENSGLPVPMSKLGQYPDPNDPKKQIVVFRPGDIFVREGAANVPIRQTHWADLLSRHDKQIRDEAAELAQSVMREFIDERRSLPAGDTPKTPLLMDMDETTFTNATVSLIEQGNDVRLRQFLRTIKGFVNANSSLDDCERALDKWAVFSAQALEFERADLAKDAIDVLDEAYRQIGIGNEQARRRLAVVIRIYALGSLAIRRKEWEVVNALALRPMASAPFDNWIYSSWIRNAQVEASRAGLTQGDRGGYLISAARDLLVNHPAMRPDIDDAVIPPADALPPNDELLNSLCQFDIAYCFIVAAEGTGNGGAYPYSAAFNEDRAAPIAVKIVDDPDTRRRLFPNSDDASIAAALYDVYETTIRESANNFGARWWAAPQRVIAFINEWRTP